jgi:hypothetical protein
MQLNILHLTFEWKCNGSMGIYVDDIDMLTIHELKLRLGNSVFIFPQWYVMFFK